MRKCWNVEWICSDTHKGAKVLFLMLRIPVSSPSPAHFVLSSHRFACFCLEATLAQSTALQHVWQEAVLGTFPWKVPPFSF
uniref:Uncharacterized protein n=1 Tax=Anguilla anguilla TaxID=7936 RepID=A0A0E9QXQ9_ANGAN